MLRFREISWHPLNPFSHREAQPRCLGDFFENKKDFLISIEIALIKLSAGERWSRSWLHDRSGSVGKRARIGSKPDNFSSKHIY